MWKRGQEQNSGEDSATAKSKPMSPVQPETRSRNFESQVSDSSCRWSERSPSTTALSNPENLGKALTQMSDVDSSSGKPFQHDCDMSDNVKHYQVRKQENLQSTESWKQAKVILPDDSFRKRSSNAVNTIDTKQEFRNMSITDSEYIRRSSDFLQQELGIQEGHESFSFRVSKTNIMMWGLFMSSSMRAKIHFGQNYERNLETHRSMIFEQIENLFSVTPNVVVDLSTEILNVKTIDSRSLCWARSTQAHDQVVRWSKVKVRVYSDSVLCLGKMFSGVEAKARWSSQVKKFQVYYPEEEFPGIDGEATEFEWTIFQDSQHCKFSNKSRKACNGKI